MSASLFDFGLYVFHNGRESLARGFGPYFYLPKLEGHLEARLWNDVMLAAEDALGLDRGSIRATVLIETITAAFEMDEILYELRDHICGLNAGRWDYIFSVAKRFHADPAFVLPDRSPVTMTVAVHAGLHRAAGQDLPPPRRPRHRRHGGVHPQPPQARGHRGGPGQGRPRTSAARPATASTAPGWPTPIWWPTARAEFDAVLGDRPNQLERQRPEVEVGAADLLDVHRPAGRDHPGRPATPTSRSASATWPPGCRAPGRPPSTT